MDRSAELTFDETDLGPDQVIVYVPGRPDVPGTVCTLVRT